MLGNGKREMGPDSKQAHSDLGFAARVSLFYGAIFLLIGFHLPYFPVWLAWRGLSPGEIAIVLSAPLAVRIVITPVISFAADRAGDWRLIWSVWVEIQSLGVSDDAQVRAAVQVIDDAMERGPWRRLHAAIVGGAEIQRGQVADALELRADRLAGLLGLADGREVESFVPDGDDMNILQALADASPQSLTNEEIARRLPKRARVGETKLRDRLKRLREANCAARPPKSPNKMHVITDVGRAILDRRSPRVDHG